jgi:hypothetical protein
VYDVSLLVCMVWKYDVVGWVRRFGVCGYLVVFFTRWSHSLRVNKIIIHSASLRFSPHSSVTLCPSLSTCILKNWQSLYYFH